MANPAPAAKALLDQATLLWPNRSKASDGIVPSAAHTAANPTSDHEIGVAGYNHAVDLTHDPKNGCDCAVIAENLRLSKDPRVKYVIHAGRIFSASVQPFVWRAYTGSNPHASHMHVSIIDSASACLNVSAWPLDVGGSALMYFYKIIVCPTVMTATAFASWCFGSLGVRAIANGTLVVAHADDAKSKAIEAECDRLGYVDPYARLVTVTGAHTSLTKRDEYVPESEAYLRLKARLEAAEERIANAREALS
jgi:hypothetical protein